MQSEELSAQDAGFITIYGSQRELSPLASPPLEPPFLCPFLSLPAGRRGVCVKGVCFTKSHSALERAGSDSEAVGGRLTGSQQRQFVLFPLDGDFSHPVRVGWASVCWTAPPVACGIWVCPAT